MDRYEQISVLGRGSFGTVLLVRRRDGADSGELQKSSFLSGPLRVVKDIDLTRADGNARQQAMREAEVLKSLSHPNVVGYDDAFMECQESSQRLCIVMEYADGGDLSAAIKLRRSKGRRYHEREAMSVFAQLAIALQYLHSRRILHRDLKSKNVFLTRSGAAKLGDFGIARVLEETGGFAISRVGTPYYLPPEMCRNTPYDLRADVWCLGIVLYELLALEVPFSSENIAGLVLKICNTEPKPIPAVYSGDCKALLARLLQKDQKERPTSAEIVATPHVRRCMAALLGKLSSPGVAGYPAAGSQEAGVTNATSASSAYVGLPLPVAQTLHSASKEELTNIRNISEIAASLPVVESPSPGIPALPPRPGPYVTMHSPEVAALESMAGEFGVFFGAAQEPEDIRLPYLNGSSANGISASDLAAASGSSPEASDAADEVALLADSLRLALDTSGPCEMLLAELEKELHEALGDDELEDAEVAPASG